MSHSFIYSTEQEYGNQDFLWRQKRKGVGLEGENNTSYPEATMANFRPLKQYMFYCLDRCIEEYHLTPPFLDVGCGKGDLSVYLAAKGWHGKAIDYSEDAMKTAQGNLKPWPHVTVQHLPLSEVEGAYNTIMLWDVIEHVENDEDALRKICSLLAPQGHLLIAVPSNPKEWRWDDDFYGHIRRYTEENMDEKLARAGMKPLLFWDFTYPIFWLLRRTYTRFKNPTVNPIIDKETLTKKSSSVNAWDIPLVSTILDRLSFLWSPFYKLQFSYGRKKVRQGHEMFVLAQRIPSTVHQKSRSKVPHLPKRQQKPIGIRV
jgi:SAM-dependent methyltransferase